MTIFSDEYHLPYCSQGNKSRGPSQGVLTISDILTKKPMRRHALCTNSPGRVENEKGRHRATSQRPHQDSNLGLCLRRATLYPLSYGDIVHRNCTTGRYDVKVGGAGSG